MPTISLKFARFSLVGIIKRTIGFFSIFSLKILKKSITSPLFTLRILKKRELRPLNDVPDNILTTVKLNNTQTNSSINSSDVLTNYNETIDSSRRIMNNNTGIPRDLINNTSISYTAPSNYSYLVNTINQANSYMRSNGYINYPTEHMNEYRTEYMNELSSNSFKAAANLSTELRMIKRRNDELSNMVIDRENTIKKIESENIVLKGKVSQMETEIAILRERTRENRNGIKDLEINDDTV